MFSFIFLKLKVNHLWFRKMLILQRTEITEQVTHKTSEALHISYNLFNISLSGILLQQHFNVAVMQQPCSQK